MCVWFWGVFHNYEFIENIILFHCHCWFKWNWCKTQGTKSRHNPCPNEQEAGMKYICKHTMGDGSVCPLPMKQCLRNNIWKPKNLSLMLCTRHLQRGALLRSPLRFPPNNYTKYLRTSKGLAEVTYFVWVLLFSRKLILLPLENSLAAKTPDGNNSNSHTFFCLSVEHSLY